MAFTDRRINKDRVTTALIPQARRYQGVSFWRLIRIYRISAKQTNEPSISGIHILFILFLKLVCVILIIIESVIVFCFSSSADISPHRVFISSSSILCLFFNLSRYFLSDPTQAGAYIGSLKTGYSRYFIIGFPFQVKKYNPFFVRIKPFYERIKRFNPFFFLRFVWVRCVYQGFIDGYVVPFSFLFV